jgi:hypothetical protein
MHRKLPAAGTSAPWQYPFVNRGMQNKATGASGSDRSPLRGKAWIIAVSRVRRPAQSEGGGASGRPRVARSARGAPRCYSPRAGAV